LTVAEAGALLALVCCLAAAIARPRGLPEALFGIPLAAILVACGVEPWRSAVTTSHTLAPTLAFLALILVFGKLCADAGVFSYLGALAGRRSGGRTVRLLAVVVALASAVTAVLTLDATVVLLTPVVVAGARQLRLPARPYAYACVELANAGSLLFPVSNLTNLLAFSASGLSFAGFTRLMALPWVVASVLEWVGLRLFFRADLRADAAPPQPVPKAPVYALAVVAVTVAGFVGCSAAHVAPAWAAGGGTVLLALPMMRSGRTSAADVVRASSFGFVGFVFALGVIVDAVDRHGAARALDHLLPHGDSLAALLGVAFIAAVAANLVNNLPATLALIPVVTGHPAAVLAVLLGVNIGPNATYVGSLATLLWRRLLPAEEQAQAGDFHRYGLLSVPLILAATTCALWLVT
jgi:arsenical pump membrane protein